MSSLRNCLFSKLAPMILPGEQAPGVPDTYLAIDYWKHYSTSGKGQTLQSKVLTVYFKAGIAFDMACNPKYMSNHIKSIQDFVICNDNLWRVLEQKGKQDSIDKFSFLLFNMYDKMQSSASCLFLDSGFVFISKKLGTSTVSGQLLTEVRLPTTTLPTTYKLTQRWWVHFLASVSTIFRG